MILKKIRVIAGEARGRKLWGPADRNTRPVTGLVKEYIFNVLRDAVEGSIIADLYAGTGSLGIEAISRGAGKVHFVDDANAPVELIRRNLKELKFSNETAPVFQMDALQFLSQAAKKGHVYDIIFADPPFKYEHLIHLIETVEKLPVLKQEGYFTIRYNQDIQDRLALTNLHQIKYRAFGENRISIFQRRVEREESDISGHI